MADERKNGLDAAIAKRRGTRQMKLLQRVPSRCDGEGVSDRFDRLQSLFDTSPSVDLPVGRERALHDGDFGKNEMEEIVEAAETTKGVILQNDKRSNDGGRQLEFVEGFLVRWDATG